MLLNVPSDLILGDLGPCPILLVEPDVEIHVIPSVLPLGRLALVNCFDFIVPKLSLRTPMSGLNGGNDSRLRAHCVFSNARTEPVFVFEVVPSDRRMGLS